MRVFEESHDQFEDVLGPFALAVLVVLTGVDQQVCSLMGLLSLRLHTTQECQQPLFALTMLADCQQLIDVLRAPCIEIRTQVEIRLGQGAVTLQEETDQQPPEPSILIKDR